jgi:hypothetical protein
MTFVALKETDPALDLIEQACELGATVAKAELQKLVAAKKYGAAAESHMDTLLSLAFSLLHHLDAKAGDATVLRFIGALSDGTSFAKELAPLCLRHLTLIFNMLGDTSPLRADTFVATLSFAVSSGQAALLAPRLRHVDAYMVEWAAAPLAQRCNIYLLISQVHGAVAAASTASTTKAAASSLQHSFACQYLTEIGDDDAALATKALPTAFATAVHAVTHSSPRAGECDMLLQLSAVKLLASSGGDSGASKKAHQLLTIFASGGVAEFNAFVGDAANKAFVDGLDGVDATTLLHRLRALILSGMGLDCGERTFAQIKDALALDDDEGVENCVVDAITSGHLDAKIDEIRCVVKFSRGTQRQLTNDTWKVVSNKLSAWQANVGKTLATLDQTAIGSLDDFGDDGMGGDMM